MKHIEIESSKAGVAGVARTTTLLPIGPAVTSADARPVLAPSEQKQLEDCEAVIGAGWDNFVKVGQALAIIRDQELYRQSFKTFEEYCARKWQYAKAHVYRLIGAAETMRILSPIGDKAASPADNLSPIGDMLLPANEAQLRPLLGLKPQDVKTAWTDAVKAARGRRVTAKLVQAAASQFASAVSRRAAASKPKTPSKARQSKYLGELRALLRDADALVYQAGQALRMRTSPGEVQAMHEQARRRIEQALTLLTSLQPENAA